MYFHVVQIWHILALSFVTGIAQSFGGPAYQSLIPSLVDKKDLPNAVALNSIQFNVARVLGPLLFAATLAVFTQVGLQRTAGDERLLPAQRAVVRRRDQHADVAAREAHPAGDSRAACATSCGAACRTCGITAASSRLIVLAAATTFLGFAVLTFLPLFAQQVFHEGASTYSHLMAFSGAGSIVGALIVAWLGKFKRMGLTALLMQAVYGLLIIAFALSRMLWLSDILLFLTGVALMVVFSTVTSLVQLIAPNEMRGRVMSIYMLAFRGGMPLGSLVSGYLATIIGAPNVIGINGVLLVVVAIYFLDPKSRSAGRVTMRLSPEAQFQISELPDCSIGGGVPRRAAGVRRACRAGAAAAGREAAARRRSTRRCSTSAPASG